MHKLARQIRFAIEPFLSSTDYGANSYCAKPTSNSLSFFFALWVELAGKTHKDSGFVINVSEIDKIIRAKAIKIFDKFIKKYLARRFTAGFTFEQIGRILSEIWQKTERDFLPAKINSLFAELMPARKLGIKNKGDNMLYFSEKFEFSASHTLWNNKFSEKENEKIFGKCANKKGHGHNYIIEVTIKKSAKQSRDSIRAVRNQINVGAFERIVEKHFIRLVDHKNLNADVIYFKKVNPTVENISEFAFRILEKKFKTALDRVTVWENDRTFSTFTAN